jgi:hypothetical protein
MRWHAAPPQADEPHIRYLPIVEEDGAAPSRRVVLAWRRSFTRYEAIAALRNAVYACALPGVSACLERGTAARDSARCALQFSNAPAC